MQYVVPNRCAGLQSFAEEDYQIAGIIPSEEYQTYGRNYTKYQAVLTATFYQPFDFTGETVVSLIL